MSAALLPVCLDQGRSDTAVFLLHGVGGGKEAWADAMQALVGAGFRAIAWDMPGYGGSQGIVPYNNKGLARALEALIDHTGAKTNIVLGHSMGGLIAQEAYAWLPQKIHGLILSGTSPSFGKPDGTWQQQFLQARFAPLDAGRGMASLAPELVRSMVGPDAGEAVIAQAAAIMACVPEASYRAALSAIVSFNRLDNLANIKVPTLCMASEHDKNASPGVMQRMAEKIPGSQYLCLPGAGHLANMEQPAAFNAAMLAFLHQHFPR